MNIDLEPNEPFVWDWVMTLIVILLILSLGEAAYALYITS
jgi:hypothetical protein